MKNYLINYRNNPVDFIDDAFDALFRPLFYDEKLDAMKTDIKETPTAYELEVEMPGFEKEDINISVEGHRYVRKERSVSCQRSYYIGDTEEDTIKAKYDKGVLSVTVPKKEEKKPEGKRSIAID